jgi:hypothetical protein
MSEHVWDTRDHRVYTALSCEVDLPKQVYLEGMYDDWEGFRLLLRDHERESNTGILRIHFGGKPVAYRCMDEGVYPASWSKKMTHWLSQVENSEYLEWFHKESGGIREGQGLVHYAIYTLNDCIDVLDLQPPKIEWL